MRRSFEGCCSIVALPGGRFYSPRKKPERRPRRRLRALALAKEPARGRSTASTKPSKLEKPLAYDEKLAERVRQLLASRRGVAEKKLMGTLAFMVEGVMCCSVGGDGLLVRVKAEERAALLTEPTVSPMKLGARTMKGFVRVAPAGLRTSAKLVKWLERGIAAGSTARSASGRGGRKR